MAWNKECHAGKDSEQGMRGSKRRHGTGNVMEGGTWNRKCHGENSMEQGMPYGRGMEQ